MNDRQREYFRRKLIAWKDEIIRDAELTLTAMQSDTDAHPDLVDRASSEGDRAIELRARDRQRKLIAKIDAALARIEDGSYGYCEETASRSRWRASMPAPSPRSRSRRRSATSAAKRSIGMIDCRMPCKANSPLHPSGLFHALSAPDSHSKSARLACTSATMKSATVRILRLACVSRWVASQ